jgi:hypothetical protein
MVGTLLRCNEKFEGKYKRELNISDLASSSNTSSPHQGISVSMRFPRTGLEGNPDFLAR